ncbi:hypothetical protein ACCS93_36990, partial [Rhizobium ruizarguesonis]
LEQPDPTGKTLVTTATLLHHVLGHDLHAATSSIDQTGKNTTICCIEGVTEVQAIQSPYPLSEN